MEEKAIPGKESSQLTDFAVRKIYFAADHAGFPLKEGILSLMRRWLPEIEAIDLGTYSADSVDYPDFSFRLAETLATDREAFGVGICGSGNGICMGLNRFAHIRAIYGWNEEVVRLGRLHNDANVLCLSGWFLSIRQAFSFVKIFITTPFEGGRHTPRVRKLSERGTKI